MSIPRGSGARICTAVNTPTEQPSGVKDKLLIIGSGIASGRMLEHLLENDAERYDITVFNTEPRVNCNRLLSPPGVEGDKSVHDIIMHDEYWHALHGVRLVTSLPVQTINTREQWVSIANGERFAYDKLVIATGADPVMIPLPGHTLQGVQIYRDPDADDVDYMMNVTRNKGRAVVIGGGLLGLEAAAGLQEQGMDVCVVHLADHLMEKQLDSSASLLLRKEFERRGVEVRTATSATEIIGDSQVLGVRLADGSRIACELVIMAVGIRPSTELAAKAGLAIKHGILVDDALCTSVDNVYALGECVEHLGKCHGLVAPLYDMAQVLACSLTDKPAVFNSAVTAIHLKINGVDLYSAGRYQEHEADSGFEDIVLRDAAAGIYKRLVLEGRQLVGIVLYGDTSDGAWYLDMLNRGTDISMMRDTLIFGQTFQRTAALDSLPALGEEQRLLTGIYE